MVLSRKKLKHKLRFLLAAGAGEPPQPPPDSGPCAGSGDGGAEEEREVRSIKELLVSSKRPRSKHKKKPRQEAPQEGEEETVDEERKTEVEEVGEAAAAAEEEQPKKKKKKPQKKKQKKKKKGEEKKEPEVVVGDVKEDGNDGEKESSACDISIDSGDSEQNLKKVYVGGIPYYSSEDDIRSFFEGCGTITEVYCMTFPESGKFRGIAILTFKTEGGAKRALALDGADMGGFYLKIQPYKAPHVEKADFAPQMIEGYNRIYVGNLSWNMTEDDLKKFFSDCKISSIRFGTDKETGEFKGYAHIDFSDSMSLALALKLDQNLVCGRPVRIRCAVPRESKPKPALSSGDQKVSGEANSDSSTKMRLCYECGTPGHLSSSCPNKTASAVISDQNKTIDGSGTAHSNKKRRTCYACGIPGHLSSACPNKKAAEVVSNEKKPEDDTNTAPSIISDEKKPGDDSNAAPKKKRRTCYQCGIPGHLSSACPNKMAASEVIYHEKKPEENSNAVPVIISDEMNTGDDSNAASSRKKKKRRTCYQCGIPGHLSSECPNKNSAEIK